MKKTRYVLLLLSTFFTLLSGFPHIILGAEKMTRGDLKKAIRTLWREPLSYLSVFDECPPVLSPSDTLITHAPHVVRRAAFKSVAKTLSSAPAQEPLAHTSSCNLPVCDETTAKILLEVCSRALKKENPCIQVPIEMILHEWKECKSYALNDPTTIRKLWFLARRATLRHPLPFEQADLTQAVQKAASFGLTLEFLEKTFNIKPWWPQEKKEREYALLCYLLNNRRAFERGIVKHSHMFEKHRNALKEWPPCPCAFCNEHFSCPSFTVQCLTGKFFSIQHKSLLTPRGRTYMRKCIRNSLNEFNEEKQKNPSLYKPIHEKTPCQMKDEQIQIEQELRKQRDGLISRMLEKHQNVLTQWPASLQIPPQTPYQIKQQQALDTLEEKCFNNDQDDYAAIMEDYILAKLERRHTSKECVEKNHCDN